MTNSWDDQLVKRKVSLAHSFGVHNPYRVGLLAFLSGWAAHHGRDCMTVKPGVSLPQCEWGRRWHWVSEVLSPETSGPLPGSHLSQFSLPPSLGTSFNMGPVGVLQSQTIAVLPFPISSPESGLSILQTFHGILKTTQRTNISAARFCENHLRIVGLVTDF